MQLCVIGAGYVGLVTAACFAEMGNKVICVERDAARLAQLRGGQCPIHEPGLESLLGQHRLSGQLSFSANLRAAVRQAEVIFIAVGTPQQEDGSADLRHVLAVADELGRVLGKSCIVVNKSTVPVGSAERVEQRIRCALQLRGLSFSVPVLSNPEFLKEGSALDDFTRPDRVIIGSDCARSADVLRRLYGPFVRNHDRILMMARRDAEFSKYAANAFLATKISFINEMASLCARLDVDIEQVRRGIGSDRRIGTHFIYAGCGYGGSCFPKDVRALIRSAEQIGIEPGVLRAVEARNALQKTLLFQALREHFSGLLQGRVVTLWGLSFKPGTDDLREAPSLVLLDALLQAGCQVRAYDPVANAGVASRYPREVASGQLQLCENALSATQASEALILVTEWKQFRQPDFARIAQLMSRPLLLDGRNLYDPRELRSLGFIYQGVGRATQGHCKEAAA